MDVTTEQAIAAIAALMPQNKPPGWASRDDMAQAWNVPKDVASNRLKRLYEIGAIERMKCLVNGKAAYAYRVR